MRIWKELDDNTKKIIQLIAIVFFILATLLLWFFGNSANKELNSPLVVFRSPLKEVRLINAEKKDGNYVISVIDLTTSKRYDNIKITKTCPNFRNPVGQKMYVAIVKSVQPVTGEETFDMERAYNYICTTKNMTESDTRLEEELRKSLKEDSEFKPLAKENAQ